MILSTISVKPHTPENAEALAAMGFDYVCLRMGEHAFRHNKEYREGIEALRAWGIKVIVTWPFYADFNAGDDDSAFHKYEGTPDITDPQYTFHTQDGRNNTRAWRDYARSGRTMQFSHWNDEVEAALIATLPRWLEDGPEIDGVHVAVSHNDRMYPTDWYPFGDEAMKGTRMYWSFDEEAQRKWAEFSDNTPMPATPTPPDTDESYVFYRWYQEGWVNRLTALTDAALNTGLKHVFTWWLPHTDWTEVNMANGTASSEGILERWRNHVIAQEAFPLVLVGSQFNLRADWPGWYSDGMETIPRVCAPPHDWDLIVGAEADVSGDISAENIRKHGKQLYEMGASGLLCGDSLWIGTEYEAEVGEALTEVRELFEQDKSVV